MFYYFIFFGKIALRTISYAARNVAKASAAKMLTVERADKANSKL